MEEAIRLLESLFMTIKAEHWKNPRGQLGVLTGIKMSIMVLKIALSKKGQ